MTLTSNVSGIAVLCLAAALAASSAFAQVPQPTEKPAGAAASTAAPASGAAASQAIGAAGHAVGGEAGQALQEVGKAVEPAPSAANKPDEKAAANQTAAQKDQANKTPERETEQAKIEGAEKNN